jgi:hypothetical protein
MTARTVFVLGAGFARAFVPHAPLAIDDYDIPSLRKRFESFKAARSILDDALSQRADGRIDLEQLMTRLGGMPYDATEARLELALLEKHLRHSVVRMLMEAKSREVDTEALDEFARLVLDAEASVVTFNYDDVFD